MVPMSAARRDRLEARLVQRPERQAPVVAPAAAADDVVQPLSLIARLRRSPSTLSFLSLILLAICWEGYGRWVQNDLLFPTLTQTLRAFAESIADGELPDRIGTSLGILATGYVIGIALAALLTTLAVASRFGTALLGMLSAMFNPLPAIALLPLALLWLGIGRASLIFVIVHSVLWAVAMNAQTGFQAVSPVLRMVGQNVGLRGWRQVVFILAPAALPSILAGLKIGWAFGWRTLIAAELVFGAAAQSGGLGWFIFENRNQLETANVFAGLLTVILIGLFVENVIFATIQERTVRRWGMQQ